MFCMLLFVFFVKQKTAYEMRISAWSSDVCSSDLGSLKGELTRSFFLFKSFPIAMVTRHWARALSAPTLQGRAAYLSALMASTTVLGMAALQTQQVVSGKDPRDMTDSRTWIQAIMRGGALSIFG